MGSLQSRANDRFMEKSYVWYRERGIPLLIIKVYQRSIHQMYGISHGQKKPSTVTGYSANRPFPGFSMRDQAARPLGCKILAVRPSQLSQQ
jgi:hypothetical protein